jgi:hypothetical protein
MHHSLKLKATLIIGIVFISALPIASAQDNAVPNQATSPYSAGVQQYSSPIGPGVGQQQYSSPIGPGVGQQQYDSPIGPGNSSSGANTGNSSAGDNTGNSSAGTNVGTFTLHNPLDPHITSVGGLVQTVIDVVSYILVLFGILALVWTGLQYVLAQGNSDRIKELHKTLLAIVIGIAIVIGARVIVQVVINTLQAANVVNSSTFNQVHNAATGN